MTKFTKGPWYVSGEGFDLEPLVVGTPHYPIAKVSHVGDLGTQANAALIAASPTMHGVLEKVSLFLEDMHTQDRQLTIDQSVILKTEVEAALAKAEGK